MQSTSSPSATVQRRWVVAAAIACALLAASCGNSDASPRPGDPDDESTTTVSQPDQGDPTDESGEGDTDVGEGGDDTGSSEGGEADGIAWPVPEWTEADPDAMGIDPVVLDQVAAIAEDGGSQCLVVSRDGQIVGEWYWRGTDEASEREAFSVTKSITSTLVGIAQDQGLLDIDQRASDFITEWVGTPSEGITIRNLLTNDSGRFQSAESDYVQMAARENDKTAYAIGLEQEHEIGTFWVYNNAAIQVLEEVLERATGTPMQTYAQTHLFEPLGMESQIATDPAGNALAFMGAQMSCRDMARFGLLFLRGGEWAGEQIVSSEWVEQATQPSTDLNTGYGYLWWLVGGDSDEAVDTAPGQGTVPGGDNTAYAALGLGGQAIAVIPEHDLVVTRLGDPQANSFSLLAILDMLQNDLVAD